MKTLNNILENASNYNDISATIDRNSWERIETISYPGVCLRKAILKAFAHANYFICSNIKVEFFDKEVKITNPGGIYQATLEQILDGVQTYRNHDLVNILSKLKYIENFSTGIQRILEAYKDSEKKSEFFPSENFFIIRLPNLNFHDQINDSLKFKNDKLNDVDVSILRAISLYPGSNAKQLLELLTKQYSNITIDIIRNSLKRKLGDYVEFNGSRKIGGYYIISKNWID